MVEMQKDRIKLDDADVELQYLQEELVNYKERQRKEMEEIKRKQLAQFAESSLGDDDGTDMSSSVRGHSGMQFHRVGSKSNHSIYSQSNGRHSSGPVNYSSHN